MENEKKFSLFDATVLGGVALVLLIGLVFALRQMAMRRAMRAEHAMMVAARAREVARQSDCRGELHSMGVALAQWRKDHDQSYPVTVDYEMQENMICNAWGKLYSAGYLDDEVVFVCPSTEFLLDPADSLAWTPWTANAATLYKLLGAGGDVTADYSAGHMDMLNSSYNYDNARIAKDSAAGRVVAGDGGWRQWMRHAGTADLDSGRDWEYESRTPNHEYGANVLYHDGAAAYVRTTLEFNRWIPHQTDAVLAGSTTSLETEPDRDAAVPGPDRPCLGAKYDWVRQGVIQNTRIEEDGLAKSASEHDDIYAIEGVAGNPNVPDQWWMLSEFQFETGILVGGRDWTTDGHGLVVDTKSSKEGMVRVSQSKIDASIQPSRHYRPGTGQPDDGMACEFGLELDAHSAGDIWSY
jgi:hypothetical protein